MLKRKRLPREHTEDWQTIKQYMLWSEQTAYELLRPLVLFGDPAIQRARETGEAKSIIDRKVDAFEETGMVSLFATKPRKHPQETARSLSPDMRQLIVDVRLELPTCRCEKSLKFVTFVMAGDHRITLFNSSLHLDRHHLSRVVGFLFFLTHLIQPNVVTILSNFIVKTGPPHPLLSIWVPHGRRCIPRLNAGLMRGLGD